MDDLRYPAGHFTFDPRITADARHGCIRAIAAAPAALRSAVEGLSDQQIDTPYRPGGWTVRQVVHHVPDSHMNAYIRIKLALSEERPTIKPYDEGAWAEMADSARTPVQTSLTLLDALHSRWVILLESMREKDFARELIHPERGLVTTDWLVQLYSWHGRHHAAHVTALRAREGW
jgi:DinB superfamily